jgi:hypothetical protein
MDRAQVIQKRADDLSKIMALPGHDVKEHFVLRQGRIQGGQQPLVRIGFGEVLREIS